MVTRPPFVIFRVYTITPGAYRGVASRTIVLTGQLRFRGRRAAATQRRDHKAGEDPGGPEKLQRRRRLAEDDRGEEHGADRLQRQRDRRDDGRQPRQRDRDQKPAEDL